MSLQTWKEEYYKIPANEVSEEDAIEHSLNKWRGLTEENLEKHNLVKAVDCDIQDRVTGDEVSIDSASCALCEVHFIYPTQDASHSCSKCPLFQVRDSVACDNFDTDIDDVNSPYAEFNRKNNPQKMIFWLDKAKEFVSKEKV